MKKTACLFLVMLLGASPSAFALSWITEKAGHEVFNGAIAGSPNTDPPSTIVLVTSFNLPLVHVEFNAGAHTSLGLQTPRGTFSFRTNWSLQRSLDGACP